MTNPQTINDPLWSGQDWLRAIKVHQLWTGTGCYGSPEVVVAVLGFGVSFYHEDLSSNIWTNIREIPDNGIDDDGNGYIDDYKGWNFLDNDNNVLPVLDDYSHNHETQVAGIIAAEMNNNKGLTGIAPYCKIMPVKFYTDLINIPESLKAEELADSFGTSQNEKQHQNLSDREYEVLVKIASGKTAEEIA